jgi:hypothetical protein
MEIVSDSITYIRKVVSPYFLNMLLMLTNVLIGFYTHSYSIMFSALLGITISTYLYDVNDANINMKFMDSIVVFTIFFPIAFLWFQHGHPTRVYAGLILLWALGLLIIDKVFIAKSVEYKHPAQLLLTPLKTIQEPLTDLYIILHYLGSYGHFVFNVEWALLVLL